MRSRDIVEDAVEIMFRFFFMEGTLSWCEHRFFYKCA